MENMALTNQLKELIGSQKAFIGQAEDRFHSMQKQLDAVDTRTNGTTITGGDVGHSLYQELSQNEGFQRLMHDRKGSATIRLEGQKAAQLFERKTTITSGAGGTVGASTSGVLSIERTPGITTEARQQLTVRDVLTARPTTAQIIDFVKVNAPMVIGSPVAEGSVKAENAVTFVTASERVKTIATWIPASRQVLDDFTELTGFINTSLPYYVNLAEEQQLLSGDGTGESLHGLIPQATAFATSLLSNTKGWNKIDQIGRAIQQITTAKELPPTFVVLHTSDWWDVRLLKDGFGRYILGDPQNGAMTNTGFGVSRPRLNIFDLDVIPTTNIAAGTFLLGSGSPIASEIRDRMEMQIDVSTEHSDYFTRNLVAIRAEKRLALVTKRPGSYITGTFTSSPA